MIDGERLINHFLLSNHLNERTDLLITKVLILVEKDVGTSLGIVKRVMVMVQVNIEGVTDGVELVVCQAGQELPAAADRVERLVSRRFNPVMFQGALQNPVIKAIVVGDDQFVGGVEGLDVLPDGGKVRGVLNVAFVNAVNLDVPPEEIGVRVNEGVEFIGNLPAANDC